MQCEQFKRKQQQNIAACKRLCEGGEENKASKRIKSFRVKGRFVAASKNKKGPCNVSTERKEK